MSIPVILMLTFVWLASTGWFRPLTLPDEGRYIGVAWEMLRSGNWAVPTLDGLPFFHKPPLFYWLAAASMATFGANEWAARLPSLIGATAAAWSLFWFIRRWVGERLAALALVVLMTCPGFFVAAQFANLDMLVAGCISVAIVLAAHAVLSAEAGRPHRAALLAAFACCGLGVLSKGLIGAVLPFLVILCWAWITGRRRAIVLLVWPPGLALFGLIAIPWFAAMQTRYAAFFSYVFIEQQFDRFAQGGFNNQQPWWFYLPVLGLLTLPWFFWVWKGARRSPADTPVDAIRSLMWAWLLTVLLFFSWPSSKLVGYILPALPPLSFVLANGFLKGFGRGSRWLTNVPLVAGLGASICLATVVAVGLFGPVSAKPLLLSLRPSMAVEDRVLMLDRYVYDADFYLRLAKPSGVVSHWHDPKIRSGDDWRKELLDASGFDPAAAPRILIEVSDVGGILCKPGTTWILGGADSVARFPWLSRAVKVAANPRLSVWRWSSAGADGTFCRAGAVTDSSRP